MNMMQTIIAIVISALALPSLVHAQSGGPTGWCTDHAGRNFRCADPSPGPSGPAGPPAVRNAPEPAVETPKSRAIRTYNRGNAAYRRGDFAEALRLYETALPLFPDARFNIGITQSKLAVQAHHAGDHERAYELFEEAARNSPHASTRKNAETYRGIIRQVRENKETARLGRCQVCGDALMDDVTIGLSASQAIRTYVGQSMAKFDNCRRGHADRCGRACGAKMYDAIEKSCPKFNLESAFRACVEQTLKQARHDQKWYNCQ